MTQFKGSIFQNDISFFVIKSEEVFGTPFNDLEYYVGYAVNSTVVISFVKFVQKLRSYRFR